MKRKVLRIFFLFAISSAIFGILGAIYSQAFMLGILLSGVVAGVALMALSCPHCGHAILFQEQMAFGIRFKSFSPWLPKTCSHCGKDQS